MMIQLLILFIAALVLAWGFKKYQGRFDDRSANLLVGGSIGTALLIVVAFYTFHPLGAILLSLSAVCLAAVLILPRLSLEEESRHPAEKINENPSIVDYKMEEQVAVLEDQQDQTEDLPLAAGIEENEQEIKKEEHQIQMLHDIDYEDELLAAREHLVKQQPEVEKRREDSSGVSDRNLEEILDIEFEENQVAERPRKERPAIDMDEFEIPELHLEKKSEK
ncbi:hypothetical protein EQV77_01110 [Halobacillus fulvus]|nr:hypothetical protein EQV77_01110 [Halobacillus fulvus]